MIKDVFLCCLWIRTNIGLITMSTSAPIYNDRVDHIADYIIGLSILACYYILYGYSCHNHNHNYSNNNNSSNSSRRLAIFKAP